MEVNTARQVADADLADLGRLRTMSGRARRLGRIPYYVPPRRRAAGVPPRLLGRGARPGSGPNPHGAAKSGDRMGLYLTSRGITNEVYYAAQKVARSRHELIDNAARLCHAPSTKALRQGVGAAATTISYGDLIDTDLVVLIGANVANGQPVAMKYLLHGPQAGAKVLVVNLHQELALERYWVPSNVESAIFGTRMTDRFFEIDTAGTWPSSPACFRDGR